MKVPLSLAIKVASLRGTLQLHIKSPPSDQLWFGFTAMPDVDFTLESSVGDHKITSGQIASFLISRFKVRSLLLSLSVGLRSDLCLFHTPPPPQPIFVALVTCM